MTTPSLMIRALLLRVIVPERTSSRRRCRPSAPEDLANLRRAELDLLELGLEHALERGLDLFDRLVDDRVVADVDALALRRARPPARPAGR